MLLKRACCRPRSLCGRAVPIHRPRPEALLFLLSRLLGQNGRYFCPCAWAVAGTRCAVALLSRGSIGWPRARGRERRSADVACQRKWPEAEQSRSGRPTSHKPTDHNSPLPLSVASPAQPKQSTPLQSTEEPGSKGLCDHHHHTKPPSGAAPKQQGKEQRLIYQTLGQHLVKPTLDGAISRDGKARGRSKQQDPGIQERC